MSIAIRVENLSKRYRLHRGRSGQGYRTLREGLVDLAKAPMRRLRSGASVEVEDFWALRDVDFEVPVGEAVGIIGRNGAGKSTLLKILSRITKPTTGRVALHGRVGSLLEVGTGFHPELTGRENIYLNGSILGMSRREITRRFDEIVAFAEVEKFLDTPVKRYSSGMYVRLAFAVAAHLEPEILIVDEVLAVGDGAFQRRCIAKMGEVARSGRTVLFVSHNIVAIRALCTRSIYLNRGSIQLEGINDYVIPAYLAAIRESQLVPLADRTNRGGSGSVRLVAVETYDENGVPDVPIATGQFVKFVFRFDRAYRSRHLIFSLWDQYGQIVVDFNSKQVGGGDQYNSDRGDVVACTIDEFTLVPGEYRMNVEISHEGQVADHVEGAMVVRVHDGALGGRLIPHQTRGTTAMAHRWLLP